MTLLAIFTLTISISNDDDFQIHFKRPPNSCFVNNYFDEGLLAWQANIDIQPVFNHYNAVTSMCAYFSKSEDETFVRCGSSKKIEKKKTKKNKTSEAMKQAAKEALDTNKTNIEQMRSISRAYSY